jgi:hypothetical protein
MASNGSEENGKNNGLSGLRLVSRHTHLLRSKRIMPRGFRRPHQRVLDACDVLQKSSNSKGNRSQTHAPTKMGRQPRSQLTLPVSMAKWALRLLRWGGDGRCG